MKPSDWIAKIKTWAGRGLWPFTPDPAEPGERVFGAPVENSPLFVSGNSRFNLARLQKAVGASGGRVLALNTRGCDLASAVPDRQALEDALTGLPHPGGEPLAVLPPALIDLLTAEDAAGLSGWRLVRGPVEMEDLPAFLGGGCALTPAMRRPNPWAAWRWQLFAAQAGLFLALIALPLAFFGLKTLLAGLAAGALALALRELLLRWQHGPIALKLGAGVLTPALAAGGAAVLSGLGWVGAALAAAAAALLGGWAAAQALISR